MFIVKKAAKISLYLLGMFVFLVIGAGIYLYVNMDSLAKRFSEQAASDALGVPVSIGNIEILLDKKQVVVNKIIVSNPPGYSDGYAIKINSINIVGESFSKDLLVFASVDVEGTSVNLEVNEKGVNLGDLQKQATNKQSNNSVGRAKKEVSTESSPMKVIVRKFTLKQAKLAPTVMLLTQNNLPVVNVPDIYLKGIGEKENGILVEDAIAQIMGDILSKFNKTANGAGFLDGLSLKMLNDIGVSTGDVFKKNLKKSYHKEVDKFKQGIQNLKGLFNNK